MSNGNREILIKRFDIKHTNSNKKHVLHVMTEAFGYGGHTRLVSAWIKNTFDTAINSVITTVQQFPIPDDLASQYQHPEANIGHWLHFHQILLLDRFCYVNLAEIGQM